MNKFTVMLAAALPLALSGVAFAHGVSEADKYAMISGGPLRYVTLGATHMLTGYDHLLFLFGVIFFLTKFRDVVKFITAFTLGHSITLLFATLFQISVSYYLIDAVIALSVCYKGFENNNGFRQYLKMGPPNLLAVIFVFGLIHGFGLSTRLQQLSLGDRGLIPRILSFNLGVEVGQIVALAGMIAILSGWRRTEMFGRFSVAANSGLIAAGLLLFLIQMHGYNHMIAPREFGFNQDAHFHAHENMQATSDEKVSIQSKARREVSLR